MTDAIAPFSWDDRKRRKTQFVTLLPPAVVRRSRVSKGQTLQEVNPGEVCHCIAFWTIITGFIAYPVLFTNKE